MKKKYTLFDTLKFLFAFIPCLIVFSSSIVYAATFNINDTNDTVDVNPGDGVCADNDGNCTLRAAIQESNALSGPDILNLPVNTYKLSIEGKNEDDSTTGDLDIIDDLVILGAGADDTIIDGNKKDRVLHIINSVKVEISDVQITNGNATFGGGLLNEDATITIDDSIIYRNSVDSDGGGIYSSGTILVSGSTILENSAALTGGGGIKNMGSATFDNCVFSYNSTHNLGGGIENHGDITINNSTLSKNFTDIAAGGINNFGTALLSKSTISNNSALNGGGINNSGSFKILNSTLFDNLADQGGGLMNQLGASIDIINSTIAENKATTKGGGVFYFDNDTVGKFELQNTIISKNIAIFGPDCFGALTSLGHNLITDISDCNCIPLQSDLVSIEAGLDEFSDSELPGTGHFPLLSDSPAVDAGSNDISPENDQLGNVRFIDGNDDDIAKSDIGAIEFIKQTTFISNRAVASEGNIAEEDISTGTPGVVETLNTSGGDLELTSDSSEDKHQIIGIRFPNMDIPKGSKIIEAFIEFVSDENQSGTVTVTFKGEASGNASLFSEIDGDVSDRPTTNAFEEWSPSDWDIGGTHKTPNLKSIVQEIVDSPGWVSGNAMAFIASSNNYPNHRTVKNDNINGPALTVIFQPNISIFVSNHAVASEGNIAEEDISAGIPGVVETLNTSESDLELTSDSDEGKHQLIGIRFPNIDIPKGSTILSAFIQFVSDENQSGTVTVTFKGEASDNASLFNEIDGDVSNRPTTNAFEEWSPSDWDIGGTHKTSNLKSIVQEIVDSPGWISGNAIVFIASSNNYPNHRTAENNGVNAPVLIITAYTVDKQNVNNYISITDDSSSLSFNPSPVPEGPAGTLAFDMIFCNISTKTLINLESKTNTLTNNNVLVNRDVGTPPSVGSVRTFPINNGLSNSILESGECTEVRYEIGLSSKDQFNFIVDVFSDVK